MKPTKSTLKEEIEFRISYIESEMEDYANNKPRDEDNLYWFYAQEHSSHSEFLQLINLFGDRIGFEKFETSKYTPIKDYITKEPLKIGDKVKSSTSEANGTLYFDDYLNQYVIRNEFNQNHKCSGFIKIEDNFDYSIDNSKVECRSNPHKKLW